MPRVTLLILCGVAAGPSGFDVLPSGLSELYELMSVLALSMVAFLLGGKMSRLTLVNSGRTIIIVSLVVVAVTCAVVASGLFILGVALGPALVLAAIATATDPAATQDVIRQTGAKGHFTSVLTGIVAVDDAWGLIVFALGLVWAQSLAGMMGEGQFIFAAREILGAALLGAVVGFPAAYLTGRLRPGDPTQAEALGVVFLVAGLAIWLEVSFLLAGMVCGCVLANFAQHHVRAFHEIEHVEWPFMTLFFFLAGSQLQMESLLDLGLLGLGYIGLRFVGRLIGGWVGGKACGMPAIEQRWVGLTLMPQAGVALGMALIASDAMPQWRDAIMTVTIGSTVVFEILGPLMTQVALVRVGDVGRR